MLLNHLVNNCSLIIYQAPECLSRCAGLQWPALSTSIMRKLASVASEFFGMSGQAMLEVLIAGDFNPEKTADLAQGKLRQKIPQLIEALEGRVGL